jgi:hypothetical protein
MDSNTRTILAIVAAALVIGLTLWSGFRSVTGPREQIVGRLPISNHAQAQQRDRTARGVQADDARSGSPAGR